MILTKNQKKKKRKSAPVKTVEEEVEVVEVIEEKKDKQAIPFKRVDDSILNDVADERLLNNTFDAKNMYGGGDGDTWASKASRELLQVKGKEFRHEKSKKKRSSWKGCGEVDLGVNSIEFDD
eukprot:GHVL01036351.1.p1 GENE.GHVL01036351.1~~GHVL01036351.1.p1  ORF type:complete len:122 (-),score=29.28 GHVL01036351.1:63-428(-)